MYDTPRTIEQILTMLAATPIRLADLTRGIPPDQLVARPEPGEWSARDVLAHLRACADVWGKYVVLILSEDRPTYKAVNPTTWIKQTDYLQKAFHASLQAFTDQRAELLEVLKPLSPEDWSRIATVIGVGRKFERTVYTYGLWLVNHELEHIRQVGHIVEAVGRGG